MGTRTRCGARQVCGGRAARGTRSASAGRPAGRSGASSSSRLVEMGRRSRGACNSGGAAVEMGKAIASGRGSSSDEHDAGRAGTAKAICIELRGEQRRSLCKYDSGEKDNPAHFAGGGSGRTQARSVSVAAAADRAGTGISKVCPRVPARSQHGRNGASGKRERDPAEDERHTL